MILHCKTILGRGQPGLMRWSLSWIRTKWLGYLRIFQNFHTKTTFFACYPGCHFKFWSSFSSKFQEWICLLKASVKWCPDVWSWSKPQKEGYWTCCEVMLLWPREMMGEIPGIIKHVIGITLHHMALHFGPDWVFKTDACLPLSPSSDARIPWMNEITSRKGRRPK